MYSEQMEMFEDGGLKDQGGTKDKVSGNDVPSGSLQKEVRDDIPAMVSEGEFIFPADVVRYHGLDKLMQMRQEAKMGLGMMEKMGQMGNSEEAELPDDLPFTVADITVIEEEDAEMNRGGILFAQEGKYIDPETGYHTGLKLPPSQADQERAAFSDFIGGSDYQNKGPRQYKLKDGSTKTIIHDYMDRPIEAVPKGATLLPLGEGIGKPTDPNLPYVEPTTSGRKEKTTAERQAKADATTARNKKAIETSAKRLGMTYDEYNDLGFGSRLALMGLELKGARGETVTDAERNAAIEKSKEGGAFGGLLGGLGAGLEKFLGKIGFDVDGDGNPFSSSKIKNPKTGKWEDPITGKEETEEAPLARPTVDGKNVAEANIEANQSMKDPDNLGNAPTSDFSKVPVTEPSFVQGMKDADKVAGTPIYTGRPDELTGPQFNNTKKPVSTGRPDELTGPQFGQTPVGSLPSAPITAVLDPNSKYQGNAASLDDLKTTSSLDKQTQNAFDTSGSFNNTAGRSAVVEPLKAAVPVDNIDYQKNLTSEYNKQMEKLKEADEALERAKALRASQDEGQNKLDVIEKSITKLEGSLLSGNDKIKTISRKTKIDDLEKKARQKRKDKQRKRDAKEGKGAFADRSKRFSKETKGYRGGR